MMNEILKVLYKAVTVESLTQLDITKKVDSACVSNELNTLCDLGYIKKSQEVRGNGIVEVYDITIKGMNKM